MSDSNNANLPQTSTALPAWLSEIPKALVPSSLKAFDRLLGAVVDYPVALIKRETAKIEAQTKAFEIVESAIAKSAGEQAGLDTETVDRAFNVLVRKEYRKQTNREAVVVEAVRELKLERPDDIQEPDPIVPPDEDWLNVFERFAEDASSERMQGLWGRVLAGEIRKPGKFSLRTLRFLSEFSQSDAVLFAEICEFAIGPVILRTLAVPEATRDISPLLQLEAAGLITGASGLGLTSTIPIDMHGHGFIYEGNLALVLKGEPSTSIPLPIIALTQLGAEVMSLIPNRNITNIMRKFAQAARAPHINAAFIGHQSSPTFVAFIEQLWLDEPPLVTS
jgi:Protein of unknown function (DUF2806)